MITIVQVNCIVPSHMTLISRRHNVDVFVLVLHFRNSMRWLWFKWIKIWLQRRYFRLETRQICHVKIFDSMIPNNGNEKVQYKFYSIVCLWVEFLDHEKCDFSKFVDSCANDGGFIDYISVAFCIFVSNRSDVYWIYVVYLIWLLWFCLSLEKFHFRWFSPFLSW